MQAGESSPLLFNLGYGQVINYIVTSLLFEALRAERLYRLIAHHASLRRTYSRKAIY